MVGNELFSFSEIEAFCFHLPRSLSRVGTDESCQFVVFALSGKCLLHFSKIVMAFLQFLHQKSWPIGTVFADRETTETS
jgi:hypothetical protein